jgi:hypothetical protein
MSSRTVGCPQLFLTFSITVIKIIILIVTFSALHSLKIENKESLAATRKLFPVPWEMF